MNQKARNCRGDPAGAPHLRADTRVRPLYTESTAGSARPTFLMDLNRSTPAWLGPVLSDLECGGGVSVFAPVPNLDDDDGLVRGRIAQPVTDLTEGNKKIPQLGPVDVNHRASNLGVRQ